MTCMTFNRLLKSDGQTQNIQSINQILGHPKSNLGRLRNFKRIFAYETKINLLKKTIKVERVFVYSLKPNNTKYLLCFDIIGKSTQKLFCKIRILMNHLRLSLEENQIN